MSHRQDAKGRRHTVIRARSAGLRCRVSPHIHGRPKHLRRVIFLGVLGAAAKRPWRWICSV